MILFAIPLGLSLTLVVLPWILGGIDPTREDLTWAILISFGTAFLSLITVVLTVFDLADSQAAP